MRPGNKSPQIITRISFPLELKKKRVQNSLWWEMFTSSIHTHTLVVRTYVHRTYKHIIHGRELLDSIESQWLQLWNVKPQTHKIVKLLWLGGSRLICGCISWIMNPSATYRLKLYCIVNINVHIRSVRMLQSAKIENNKKQKTKLWQENEP